MKRISLITGVPQRLTFLIAGLVIILWGDTHPVLALSALVLAPLLSGIFGGIGHGAWTQLVARTVPANRRSSLSATRNVIGTSIGVVAGFFIQWLLNQYDGTFAFGLLHIIAFGFMMLSYFFFSRIQEVIVEPVIKEKNRSLREYVDELWAILRVDRNFRHFAIMRVTGPFGQFVSPYMTIYAIDVLNASAGFAGTALIVTNIGQYLGNAIGGILGDRLGGRLLLVSARTLFLASFIFATTAESYLSFLVYFFVSALATSINGIGNMTLMMEIAPDHRRPTYGALNGLLNGPSMLILSLVGAVYWSTYGAMQLQALIATAGMIVSMYFIWKVKEPRLITPNP